MNKATNLIRSFEKPEHAEDFQKGNIILRSLAYYRLQCEYENGDRKEGAASNNSGGKAFIMPHFVLCMHDTHYNAQDSRYGKYKVIIHDIQDVLWQMEKIMADAGVEIYYSAVDQVQYYDDNFVLRSIPNEKLAFYKPEYSSDTSRSIAFKDDLEWRILLTLWNEEPINTPNIELQYFRFKNLGHNPNIEQLSYKEWNDSQHQNPVYTELHFKNIKFDSHLIGL